MADIVASVLEVFQSGSDSFTYVTGSISPAANRTVLLITNGVQVDVTPAPIIPIVSGVLPWSLVASELYEHAGVDRARISVFRGVGASPTPGTVSVNFGPRRMLRQAITIIEFTNTDIGNLGANAIVGTPGQIEIALGSGLNPSLAQAAGEDAANSLIGVLGYAENSPGINPGIGFITLQNNSINDPSASGGNYTEMSQVVLSDVDFNVSGDPTFVIFGIELRNATPSPPPAGPQQFGRPAFISGNLIT